MYRIEIDVRRWEKIKKKSLLEKLVTEKGL